MTLSSVLYEALRPRVGSHILHGPGARIYEYVWVRSGFIDTPSCRRHTTPPLSRTSSQGRRRHTRMEGAHRCYLLTKQSRSVRHSLAWHTRRSAASLSRCTDIGHGLVLGNGRKWVWKGGEKTGRGSHDGKEKEGNTYQYEDPTTSQRTWTAALQHRQAMTPFQSRQEQVQTPWLRV